MLAGLQGAGKTTLAGKLGYWLKDSGHTPLLVAADLQRPNAVTQLQVVGERAGVPVYAPEKGVQSDGGEAVVSPGQTTGDPVKVACDAVELAKQKLYDTATRSSIPQAVSAWMRSWTMKQASRHPRCRAAERDSVRHRRDDRPGCRADGQGVRRGRGFHRRGAVQARWRRPWWRRAVRGIRDRQADPVRLHRRGIEGFRGLPPRIVWRPASSTWAIFSP